MVLDVIRKLSVVQYSHSKIHTVPAVRSLAQENDLFSDESHIIKSFAGLLT